MSPKSEGGFHLNAGTQLCSSRVLTKKCMILETWVKSIFVAEQLQSLIGRLTRTNAGLLGQKLGNI